jgi:hypothetical protein
VAVRTLKPHTAAQELMGNAALAGLTGGGTVRGAELTNAATGGSTHLPGYPHAVFFLAVGGATAPLPPGCQFALRLLRTPDGGVAYEDGDAGYVPDRAAEVRFFPKPHADAQLLVGEFFRNAVSQGVVGDLPAGKFKPLLTLEGGLGVALGATGHRLSCLAHTVEDA